MTFYCLPFSDKMSSLSAQNRQRIESCITVIQGSLNEDPELSQQAAQALQTIKALQRELEDARGVFIPEEPSVDAEFVDSFLSSGCFAKDLETLKEAEGAAWGSSDLQTLAECLRDIPRGLSLSQQEQFLAL
jgi:hypothetical protein